MGPEIPRPVAGSIGMVVVVVVLAGQWPTRRLRDAWVERMLAVICPSSDAAPHDASSTAPVTSAMTREGRIGRRAANIARHGTDPDPAADQRARARSLPEQGGDHVVFGLRRGEHEDFVAGAQDRVA